MNGEPSILGRKIHEIDLEMVMEVQSTAQGHIIGFYKVNYGYSEWKSDVLDVCGCVFCSD